jgi:hypothetical protein
LVHEFHQGVVQLDKLWPDKSIVVLGFLSCYGSTDLQRNTEDAKGEPIILESIHTKQQETT